MPSPEIEATLEKVDDLSPTVRGLHLVVVGVKRFHFKPGQWITLHIPAPGRALTRPYSIASPPRGDARFEVCARHVQRGAGADPLWGLRPGARLRFAGPFGDFVLREPIERNLVFVATGTGISPIRSMIHRAMPHSSGHRLTLLFGARGERDLLYCPEWDSLEHERPDFRFIPTLSRPGPGWGGLTGYVQDATPDLLAKRIDADIYICGQRKMVTLVRDQCREWGYPEGRVHFENYG